MRCSNETFSIRHLPLPLTPHFSRLIRVHHNYITIVVNEKFGRDEDVYFHFYGEVRILPDQPREASKEPAARPQ